MEAARIVMEEAAIGAVKLVEPVDRVLGGMAVDHVEQHGQTPAMRGVDELLQVLWGAEPTVGR